MIKTYNVAFEEMSAQLDRNGQHKLDANGKPLQSIRIKQDNKQKRKMLRTMLELLELYQTIPHKFPKGKFQISNDPKEYTIKQMMKDFDKRLDNWLKDGTADLYKSFVDRHNFILEQINYGEHIDTISLVDMSVPLIERSGLFDIGC
jgi:hypothetical protein